MQKTNNYAVFSTAYDIPYGEYIDQHSVWLPKDKAIEFLERKEKADPNSNYYILKYVSKDELETEEK